MAAAVVVVACLRLAVGRSLGDSLRATRELCPSLGMAGRGRGRGQIVADWAKSSRRRLPRAFWRANESRSAAYRGILAVQSGLVGGRPGHFGGPTRVGRRLTGAFWRAKTYRRRNRGPAGARKQGREVWSPPHFGGLSTPGRADAGILASRQPPVGGRPPPDDGFGSFAGGSPGHFGGVLWIEAGSPEHFCGF